jgi:hypothetical protein
VFAFTRRDGKQDGLPCSFSSSFRIRANPVIVPIIAGRARAALRKLPWSISLRFNGITSKDRIDAESVLQLLLYETNLFVQHVPRSEQARRIVLRNM